MPETLAPLFLPEALNNRGSWRDWGTTHRLSLNDFAWLSHVNLTTQAQRGAQSRPMTAERLLIQRSDEDAIPLAGSFVLHPTPDDNGALLYSPFGGLKKFDSLAALKTSVTRDLRDPAQQGELISLLSLEQRQQLAAATAITLGTTLIDNDVFENQQADIRKNQAANASLMLQTLMRLPSLRSLLHRVLDEALRKSMNGVDQRETQVSFYRRTDAVDGEPDSKRLLHSMQLADALLLYYRQQGWPIGQIREFSHPQRPSASSRDDQQQWDSAIKTAAESLTRLLSSHLETFWNTDAVPGTSRRELFAQAISDKARADFLFKRQQQIITPAQSTALAAVFDRDKVAAVVPPLSIETVRLWEYEPDYVELAGSLMLEQTEAFLYTPANGLQVLENYQDLLDTVKAKFSAKGHEDELYGLLTREERDRFVGFDQPSVSGAAITSPAFAYLFEAIVGKQLRNLDYALSVFRHSDGVVDVHALFDQALDIRAMVDPVLSTLDAKGRWSTWPMISGQQAPSKVLAEKAALALKTCASLSEPLQDQWARQLTATSVLQRTFIEAMKPQLAHAMSVAINTEAQLRVLSGTLQSRSQAIVNVVLDPDKPDRARRAGLNGFRPDAYWLTLTCSGQQALVPVARCFLLTERGGLDSQYSGQAIVWTPARGLEVFESILAASTALDNRLKRPADSLALLENVPAQQRHFHRTCRLGPFRLIEGSVLENRLQSALEHYLSACDSARALNLSPHRLSKTLEHLKALPVPTGLTRTAQVAQAIVTQQSLPAWLAMAPNDEQSLHLELLEQYRQNVTDDQDYLHGIKTLSAYAREQLESLQKTRFNGKFIDADQVVITPDLTLAGPPQTLTEFAISPTSIHALGFKVSAQVGKTLPAGLDTSAVRQLLLRLNIKSAYATLLKEQLSEPTAAQRQQRFMRQLPWQLLHHAHALKLQEQLSDAGFDLVRQVLDTPDGLARRLVDGATAIARPLELIKTIGAAAVRALGLYVIGPGSTTQQPGPQILYAPYSPEHGLMEFASEAALVAGLNTPGVLQDLLIRRLPSEQQATFSNLFKSSIKQVSELTLASNPINGNLLKQMFQDNLDLLSLMLGGQSDPRGHMDWSAIKQLLSSGIQRTVGFLPGKLSYGLFLWQSYQDFKASAEALQNHHWGTALDAFVSGAAQMVTLGRMMHPDTLETTPEPSPPVESPIAAVNWSDTHITAPLRTRLQPFEAQDVELKNLGRATKDATYLEPTSKKHYAPVSGKLYQVERSGPLWRIVNATEQGPYLRLTSRPEQVLDLDRHSIHPCKALSSLINRYVSRNYVRQWLNIEARGMDQIQSKYPDKARMIIRSMDLARHYAFNALHNLSLTRNNAATPRLERFFKEVFDVSAVDQNLLDKIKTAIVPVCTALVDPALDELDSKRFVVGSNLYPQSNLIAFVDRKDRDKSVHFTELFFDQQLDWYQSCLSEPFDVTAHAQASTVIHEFSHLYSKTVDIASLEARRPFSDLITPITGYGAAMKQSQIDFQRNALSMYTPREELFTRWNSELNLWQDLDLVPSQKQAAKVIMEVTGTHNMEDARTAFLDRTSADRRIDIILRNADSVARLICEMGRQLDPAVVTPATSP